MRDIEAHESMRRLNPCSDKLGRERDFKDATNTSLNWITTEIKQIIKRIEEIENELYNRK